MPVELPISAIGLLHLDAMHRAAARRRLVIRKVRHMLRALRRFFTSTPATITYEAWLQTPAGKKFTGRQHAHAAVMGAALPETARVVGDMLSFRDEVERLFPVQQYESRPASRWRDLGEAGGIPTDANAEAAWEAYQYALREALQASKGRRGLPETPRDTAVAVAMEALSSPHNATGETPAGFLRGWRATLLTQRVLGNRDHDAMINKLDWLLMRLAEAEDALRDL